MPEQSKQPSESINQDKISQPEMIELLQKTIGQLEVIVNKLSTESLDNLPPRMVIETLTSNTEVLAELFDESSTQTVIGLREPQGVNVAGTVSTQDISQDILFNEEEIDFEEPTEPVRVDQVASRSGKSKGSRGGLLRSIVPTGLRDKLPNWAVIAVLATVTIAVVSVSVVWVSRSSPEIAQTPTTINTPTLPNITPPTPTSTPEAIATPAEIEAPGNPEPVEFAPPPKPELTPEQSLIAAIQEEVSELTRKYPEGLIATIEANFLGSRLIVTMGSQWYDLTPSRQNSLANAIFERSRRLDFRKLELIDKDGVAIARSPVVGEDMVILQREKIPNPTT